MGTGMGGSSPSFQVLAHCGRLAHGIKAPDMHEFEANPSQLLMSERSLVVILKRPQQ